ncbi:hypothetical protein [Ancylobacter lacus]|uniref:hypothetical protein n=1 Tax=Ancylobacter lacus TaxID=2579970 RepID=UPI001BCB7C57|nr:hypothetical protein [Ancylobacter lacus]MBS7538455.1 hypothetical protein [Ancylobacter lacus]
MTHRLPARSRSLPRLATFLLGHAAIGFALGIGFVAALLVLDVARLGTLVRETSLGYVGGGALTFALGLTFASAQMGFAVMLLGQEEATSGGGLRRGVGRLALARIRTRR